MEREWAAVVLIIMVLAVLFVYTAMRYPEDWRIVVVTLFFVGSVIGIVLWVADDRPSPTLPVSQKSQ